MFTFDLIVGGLTSKGGTYYTNKESVQSEITNIAEDFGGVCWSDDGMTATLISGEKFVINRESPNGACVVVS